MTLKFLLLEDNLEDADVIRGTLSDGGIDYEILRVETHCDFVSALQTNEFDLIIANYGLSGFDGLSALKIARNLCPNLPFIFVSATLGEELAIKTLKQGATDYVLKQRLGRLVPSVERSLREAREHQRAKLLFLEQKRLLELIALGNSLDSCLSALCDSVSRLNATRACFLLTDARRTTFPRSITPDFPPSFGAGLKDAPINDLCIGTCGEAVYRGQQISCSDILNDDRWSREWRDLCVSHGILACHSKPVLGVDGLPLGSLMLCFDEARMPTNWEYQLAEFGTQVASIVFERDRSTLALEKSKEKYRTLFESIDEGFCICEMLFDQKGEPQDYRFLEVNPIFEMMTGLKRATGKTARELVPDLEPFWFQTYGRVVMTGEPVRFEQRSLVMQRWFDVNAFCIGEPQNHQFAVLFTNISNRKQIEQERERFLLVGSDLQVITGNDGYFQWVSPTFERTLGWTASEMLSRPWTDFVHSEDLSRTITETENLFLGNQTLNFENRYRHQDGSYRWLLWKAQAHPEEQVIYGAAVDITERKQAEETLRAKNERLKLLSETTSELLSNENCQSLLESLSQKLSTHLNLEIYVHYLLTEDGQRLQLIAHGGISDEIATAAKFLELGQAVCGYVVQQQKTVVMENALESTSPLALPLRTLGIRTYVSHPLIVNNRAIGTLSFGTRDRDRFTLEELELMQTACNQMSTALQRSHLLEVLQQRAAELAEVNRIKDEFLAIVSHELRTPLNPILGWTNLLRKGKLDEAKTADALEIIERNTKLQVQLIEDLLDISRILRGKLSLNVIPVDLNVVIKAALETVRLAAEAKSLQIQTILSPKVVRVNADIGRLQQVVWNLLSNAVKFTPQKGQITLELTTVEGHAQIQVTDTGKGIDPDFLPYIFEHFRQEDGAITRKFGGLGLGLAIVRYLVELHGGTVWAESPGIGQGATFTVKLPLMPTSADLFREMRTSELTLDLTDIQVLVVDDDADTREFVAFLIEQYGATAIAVNSAREALVALTRFKPDLLLSDIGMPEMDGYMLMQQLRSLPPERGGQIPAIALTAYAGEIDYQQAMAAGFQKHIAKPVEPAKLAEAIASLVGAS
jgi:PAS domain S-box-containing protein